ncbi:phage tail spike protein [Bacillus paramycoides]|uniref:phage tail spike protein n=1 Tax=Bacillus paramycoides TaxID=2026194 RepID=UPI003D08ED08
MRTPSGTLHVVDFQTEQIVSAIQSKDYWDDIRHWEVKNNIDKLDFKVFDNTDHAATLMQQNLVLKEVRDGRVVPYVITEIEKDSDDRSVTNYASGEWILLGKANYIPPQKLEGKTVSEMVDIALAGTKWEKGNLDYAGFHSITIDEYIDPLSFLKKIASLFDLEIQYRAEVVGNQIVGRYVDMVKKRGRETGKEVTLGKDLMGIKRIENSQNICTALMGFVKGEGDKIITVESINNGLPYIVDNDAFQRWNEKGQHKFGFYTPETEQDITPQRLMTLMKTELKKRNNASYSYEVQAQSIGRVFGLTHELINEGDTIRIKDTGFTPKLYLEARAIAGDESFTDPSQDKYVFGDYREIVDANEELRKLYNNIRASLWDKQVLIGKLDELVKETAETANNAQKESQAAKELAEKVQENLKNNTVNIIESKNPPTDNLIVGKTLWRDINNGKPGILKVWNGNGWELMIPDVESVKKETLEQVNKDIQSTREELNKKVEEAQNETAGQFNEVNENLQEVSRTIKNVQNSQGEINKTVSKMKQTNEGFTKSIELLTKKDGEITEKLNTVVETSEGTKKIVSEVQQTTTDLKKTTNEITEKAGQISEKLGSVEKKVNNDKAGGRNLLLNSNVKYEKTDYLINQYTLSENFSTGEEYTFVIKGSVPQGQKFGIWQNGSSNNVGYATSVYANGITYVTFKAVAATSGNERKLSLYNYPSNTTKATVEWVALYKGNKPQDWTPAPENQVTNDEFTKKTNEIIKSVEGTTETIKRVEKTQDDFSERVNTVEKNAEGFTQSVKKLQETQRQQGKTLSEATTTIGQHSEALKLTMKKKDVEDYVGGIGSTNEIRDATFKQDFKYWTKSNGNTVIDKKVTYKGFSSIRTITQGETADKWFGGMSNLTEVSSEEDIVDSAYFYTDDPASIDKGAALQLEFFDASGGRIQFPSTAISLSKGVWTRFFVTAKVPAGAVKARLRYHLNRNGRIWMALPMLQRGTTPSLFAENPNDIVNKDKIMEDLAEKVATEKYNQKVTELERSITANTKGVTLISEKQETFINETFDAYVKKTGSKLQVLDEGILAQVKNGNIISAINQTAEKITIDVAKLNINADTMVKWLTAKGIDTNIINVNGDKITIDKNGVTVKMLDFLFEDEWGTKTTAVARRNLIADSDFSSVGKKNIGNGDYYGFEGGYGLTWKSQGNVVIEKNTSVFDYEQMVNAARVDMYNYPEAVVNNGIHPGNEYTLSAHFRASMINGVRKTAKPRLHVCCVKFRDNVSYDIWNEQKMDFPEPSIFYGEIRRYSFTFKVPTNYKPQEHTLIIKVCSANGQISAGTAICASGVTLYSGKYASMYNWDRAAAERAAGIQPFNSIAIDGVNNHIGPAPDGQTFDISTEKEVKFSANIRAVQGVNLGGNAFQG